MGYLNTIFPQESKFFVTSGAGFIGSNQCEAILKKGYFVRCLDDLSTGKQANVDLFARNPEQNCLTAARQNLVRSVKIKLKELA